jgi:hypothetical protein
MGIIHQLKPKNSKHRLRLDADGNGYFVQMFPPASRPNPTWRFGDYREAKAKADALSGELGLRVHDAIRPPFLERFS